MRAKQPTQVGMIASPVAIPGVDTWDIGAVQGEGLVRSYPISCGGMDLVLSIPGCLAPFDASALNGAPRKTLTLRVPKDWDAPLGDMEDALLGMVCAKSELFFQTKSTMDEIAERYKPITKKMGKYPRNLRAKLNADQTWNAVRYWNAERIRIDAPAHHAGMTTNAVVRLRAIWVSADAWGLVCDASDLQVLEAPVAECPFAAAGWEVSIA